MKILNLMLTYNEYIPQELEFWFSVPNDFGTCDKIV